MSILNFPGECVPLEQNYFKERKQTMKKKKIKEHFRHLNYDYHINELRRNIDDLSRGINKALFDNNYSKSNLRIAQSFLDYYKHSLRCLYDIRKYERALDKKYYSINGSILDFMEFYNLKREDVMDKKGKVIKIDFDKYYDEDGNFIPKEKLKKLL